MWRHTCAPVVRSEPSKVQLNQPKEWYLQCRLVRLLERMAFTDGFESVNCHFLEAYRYHIILNASSFVSSFALQVLVHMLILLINV